MTEGPHGRRGRPRLAVPPQVYHIKLRLYPGQDDDLIAFLAAVPPRWRSAAVKVALRTGSLETPLRPGPRRTRRRTPWTLCCFERPPVSAAACPAASVPVAGCCLP